MGSDALMARAELGARNREAAYVLQVLERLSKERCVANFLSHLDRVSVSGDNTQRQYKVAVSVEC